MTQTIYRIQHRDDGYGPYRYRDFPYELWQCQDHEDQDHPSPWEDKDLCEVWRDHLSAPFGTLRFGFKSLDQLRNWFTREEQMKLAMLGFQVVKFHPRRVWHGAKQSIFIHEED